MDELSHTFSRPGGTGNWTDNYISGSAHAHLGHVFNIYEDGDPKAKCMKLLYSDYERGKNLNPRRVPNTCGWFLDHHKFLGWRDSLCAAVLWVGADAGCGKSVLSRALIDESHIASGSSQPMVCYFFFKEDHIERRNAETALCALLYQIFTAKPSLMEHVMPRYEKLKDSLRASFTELWGSMESVAWDPKAGPIVCILDALDECEEHSRNDFIEAVTNFILTGNGAKTQLKFLMTSRPYPDIEGTFRDNMKNPRFTSLLAEDNSSRIRAEINMVIEDRLPKIFNRFRCPPTPYVQSRVVRELKRKDNSTYLWLSLVLNDLVKTSLSDEDEIYAFINQIPQDLDAAYGKLLGRILPQHWEEATRLFHIILAAKRPLDLLEMNIALAIAKRPSTGGPFSSVRVMATDAFIEYIRTISGSFISILDSKIYLIHQTARDFLMHQRNKSPDCTSDTRTGAWKGSFQQTKSQLVLANVCIAYLLLDDFEIEPLRYDAEQWREGPEMVRRYEGRFPFLNYAGNYWNTHFRGADFGDDALLRSVKQLCKGDSGRCQTWLRVHRKWAWRGYADNFPSDVSTFEVAALFGITPIVASLMHRGETDLLHTQSTSRLLTEVVEEGHVDTVKLILDNATDLNAHQALVEAASRGNLELVKILGPRRDVDRQYALLWACRIGHIPVIKYLIEKMGTEATGPALSYAAEGGQPEVVRLLVERYGVDVDTDVGCQPALLSVVSRWGRGARLLDVVKLLLELGANPNCSVPEHTALQFVAETGDVELLKVFIEAGADINMGNSNGITPLMETARCDNLEAAKFLINLGVNIQQINNDGETALYYAANSSNSKVYEYLLEVGGGRYYWNHGRNVPLLKSRAGSSLSVSDNRIRYV